MRSLGFVLLLVAAVACNNKKSTAGQQVEEEETGFSYDNFSERFRTASLPFQLTDTGLLANKDTAALRNATFAALIPDSVKSKVAGKGNTIKYIPLYKVVVPKGETYYLLKTVSGNRKAALMTVFDKEHNYSASFPFLVPDEDDATSQVSSIDKSYTIARNVARKTKEDVVIEGKDVYVYNSDAKAFTLIMTDVLDENAQELINPIDTFSRRHKFAGDYVKDKRNIVSVRDGRHPNELMVFVHFEKDKGACNGELKGTLLFTSSTTAVYRQGGDPCVLEFKFSSNSVTLKEDEGCGSHRDMTCVFDGTYARKKEAKAKTDTKKSKKEAK